ncbi:hypothetical protein EON67_10880 [archaeon]|nr:MAG: hypothetical protein EON67_10880 [archaeon]
MPDGVSWLQVHSPHCHGIPFPCRPTLGADQYDTSVTTWSPQGRLFQVEYAMEAVKQGSAAVGVVGRTHAVLAGIKRCVR